LVIATPQDSELFYNQACAYALAKKPDEAVKSLQMAIGLDSKWRESARHDADFSSLHRTKVYRAAFSSVRFARSDKASSKKKASRKGKARPTRASRTTK
jgi:hypothetical protein